MARCRAAGQVAAAFVVGTAKFVVIMLQTCQAPSWLERIPDDYGDFYDAR